LSASLHLAAAAAELERVTCLRVPEGGIQPQTIAEANGTLHLLYFKGPAEGGNLFYVTRRGDNGFSPPIRVNHQPGSAMAIGTIRGGQMALGRVGRVHVAWNGPAPKEGGFMAAPILYTRLNDSGTAFEPERDLITKARGLDGGGSLAADDKGNVYVLWHAPIPGSTNGEAERAVFVAHSTDDGRTFAPEKQASPEPTGACGCCGMKAFADTAGNVFALYRAATEMVSRNETLLLSRDRGASFNIAYSHQWKIASCPMSSAFLSETLGGVLAAAETHERVFYVRLDPVTGLLTEPVCPSNHGKHPVAVSNAAGEVLLAWTEGTGWGKGGRAVWQIFNRAGEPISEQGQAEGVPAWSLVAAVAKPDGRFVIIY
jgi:hypothetical protein